MASDIAKLDGVFITFDPDIDFEYEYDQDDLLLNSRGLLLSKEAKKVLRFLDSIGMTMEEYQESLNNFRSYLENYSENTE